LQRMATIALRSSRATVFVYNANKVAATAMKPMRTLGDVSEPAPFLELAAAAAEDGVVEAYGAAVEPEAAVEEAALAGALDAAAFRACDMSAGNIKGAGPLRLMVPLLWRTSLLAARKLRVYLSHS
jgi:hypothetical protein